MGDSRFFNFLVGLFFGVLATIGFDVVRGYSYVVFQHSIPGVDYDRLLNHTVCIEAPGVRASGVTVTRTIDGARRVFVWTNRHVVVDSAGRYRQNITVSREVRVHGWYKHVEKANVQIIACDPTDPRDLALLEVMSNVDKFFADPLLTAASSLGTEIVHVGCSSGWYGSVSYGTVAMTDRIIKGAHYDQVSCLVYPGASGGGVYLPSGELIGLVTLGGSPQYQINMITPMRAMVAWAKEHGVLWVLQPD